VRTFFAVVWSLFMVGTVATILVSAASMFEGLLGWPFWFSVGLTSALVGIFTTSGGLKAVAVTDAVSCVVLIAGAALLCGIGLWQVGGPTALIERVSALPWTGEHLELLPSASHEAYPWPAVILGLGLVLGPAYWVGNQAIVQRTFGTRTEADARASYVFAAVIKLVFPVLLVLPGLLALALFADELGAPGAGWDANRVLPLLIAELIPTGALGLLMGAFIAAVMANLDSYINSASTLLVTDLYRPFLRPAASDEECLRAGRWLVVGLLVVGALVSYQVKVRFGSVFEAFQTFLSFFQGALFSLLLFGMLTRRATAAGGVAGMLVGVGSAAVLNATGQLFLWTAFWSFVAASAALAGVSAVTSPKSDGELRGLVTGVR
jgi:SSS family solute:Na+ symporter